MFFEYKENIPRRHLQHGELKSKANKMSTATVFSFSKAVSVKLHDVNKTKLFTSTEKTCPLGIAGWLNE